MMDFFRLVPKKRSVRIKADRGIIFHNPSGYKKYVFYVGNLVFLMAIAYLAYLYWPLFGSLIKYNVRSEMTKQEQIAEEKKIEATPAPPEEFLINIPKIGAEARVVTGVSPFNKKEYLPILEKDEVAQARDTGMPGQSEKAIYLFAHSTTQGLKMVRKNSVFYLLGQMNPEDYVFVSYNGTKYQYKVYEQKVVNASDIQYLDYKTNGKEILILQTCWPIGTDWKRLLVFAERSYN